MSNPFDPHVDPVAWAVVVPAEPERVCAATEGMAYCSGPCAVNGCCRSYRMVPAGNKIDPATAACDTVQASDERTT